MMPFSEILSMALNNIRTNKLRAVLTLLIIAFGIMALVGILTAIDAIAYSLNDSFSGLGANSFSIERKWGDGNERGRRSKPAPAVNFRQASAFKERFTFPARVALGCYGTGSATVKYEDRKTNPNVTFNGADENFLDIKGFDLAAGRNFTKSEAESTSPLAIIGQDVLKKLFDGNAEKALDKIITVNNTRLRVIGVIAEKGSSMNEQSDRRVYAPLYTLKALYGADEEKEYFLLVAVSQSIDMDAAESESIGLFRQIRGLKPGQDDDFETFTSNSLVGILKDSTTNLRLATIAIGLMTLLGAAIGLMNIMLVSVTERTREIGIYKALGATSRSILLQFLLEAIIICQIGGVVGIFFGVLIGNIVTLFFGSSFLVPWAWMFLAFTLCMIVGVVSGFYPAMKAAKLDPIESLRYE